jgi:hypothetical protein
MSHCRITYPHPLDKQAKLIGTIKILCKLKRLNIIIYQSDKTSYTIYNANMHYFATKGSRLQIFHIATLLYSLMRSKSAVMFSYSISKIFTNKMR